MNTTPASSVRVWPEREQRAEKRFKIVRKKKQKYETIYIYFVCVCVCMCVFFETQSRELFKQLDRCESGNFWFLHLTSRCPRSVQQVWVCKSLENKFSDLSNSLKKSHTQKNFFLCFQKQSNNEFLSNENSTKSLLALLRLSTLFNTFIRDTEWWHHWRMPPTWNQLCIPWTGVTEVNCAQRHSSPRLNWDRVITGRSKTSRRKRRGRELPSSQREAVSHLSDSHHSHSRVS